MTSEPVNPHAGQVWNLPNMLTMLRIVMVPFFMVLLWQDTTWSRVGALAVFLLAALTDKLDGSIARARNLVTNFGKIADPFADKMLVGGAIIMLSMLGDLPWWATITIIAREAAITILRFIMVRRWVMAASKGGKLKTVMQVIFIALMILPAVGLLGATLGGWIETAAFVVMLAAVLVTVVTGLDYLIRAIKVARSGATAQ
ncbi:CDP-diacylglycerol--glycerol-3-phosphate 3-phosphatidyltransferase [Pseudactinotalea sp. Z1739]|uniref:CDP-diacylglycerol--glycerol-3-phosphate 3-phosphatidyltransferase n=1 Tax=Pseudactinotalea sp. Z1739 TaxID=3413028 RepID=UPI003C7C0EBB